ncbi:ATP-binding protein [Psychrosphaera sp. 1_MG-2023]|uniref:ATP-binding protein n=1 Tax=Psychrosphaera sp. 1_MG-2023 TaxID=3062643 RepID=UPI0026E48671|nr:ATP-binding protein [Psychrosphaera sp. 1_MG-2023]MDO6719489.1 ATP-binding protein [Psychrosphaera sp. 1_MG-2023]
MRRLFFSLYIVITLGLLIINWASEYVWQELQSTQQSLKNKELNALAQLAAGNIKLVSEYSLSEQLARLNQSEFAAYSQHSIDDFAFAPSQMAQLKAGQAVHLFDQQGLLVVYVVATLPTIYKIDITGDYALDNQNPLSTSFLLTFISYTLLAGLILIWTRPLWTDINKLTRLTEQFSSDTTALSNPLSSRSVVYPLGKTLSRMSHTIVELISLQKQMTHAISHDIRTPLARLKFSIAIMKGANQSPDDQVELTGEMLSDIEEIERLIDEMLTYGRLDTVSSPLTIEEVNINQLIENLVEKLQRTSDVPIGVQISGPVSCLCDGHLLERAIQNIIVNGLRYARTALDITVTLDELLTIIIDDDGPGISPDQRQQIFSPFTRLENSRNKLGGGFGLGLSIADKIISWHGGEIIVAENTKKGARFILTMPIANQRNH